MKKIIIILLLISFNVNSQNENQKKTDLILNNDINEILTYQYNEKGDSIQTGIDIYDKKGNLTQDLRLKDDKIVFKYLIEYNEKNLMIKQTGYNEKGEVSSILLYEYDDNGNQISYKQIREDGEILGHQKRTYNTKNLNTELYNLNSKNNEFYLSYKFFYNDNNLYESTESYNLSGNLTSTTKYEYENGNLIRLVSISNNQKYKTSYKYDEKEHLIEKEYHRNRSVIINGKKIILKQWKETFEYDSENNITSKISSGNGLNFTIEKYFYKKN